jgi:hypothetical protein
LFVEHRLFVLRAFVRLDPVLEQTVAVVNFAQVEEHGFVRPVNATRRQSNCEYDD